MKVSIQSVNFNADKALIDFVEEKAKQLDKFYDKIINIEVFLKVQQTAEKDNKHVEIKISIPGDEFMVKKQAKYMEEGVNMALDTLKRQLLKKKEKIRD
ncbi:MAG: ribosome-associated translation inhibitor RaiA [Flavobacteriales bacterium]|jgi:putative sigma-54 modulation protein|nr:ribosome-associated translation inhibitor RaiA [Flavobacteriales bacterium]